MGEYLEFKNSIIGKTLKEMNNRIVKDYKKAPDYGFSNPAHQEIADDIIERLTTGELDFYNVMLILECVTEAILFRKFKLEVKRDV